MTEVPLYSLVQGSSGSLAGRSKPKPQVQTTAADSSLALLAGQGWQGMAFEVEALYVPGRQAAGTIEYLLVICELNFTIICLT